MNNFYGPGNDDYGRDKWPDKSIKRMIMKPTIGRIVIYYPTKEEQELLNNYQKAAPAVITSVWSDTCVNLKVLHDGNFDRWKTSISLWDPATPFFTSSWGWPVIE